MMSIEQHLLRVWLRRYRNWNLIAALAFWAVVVPGAFWKSAIHTPPTAMELSMLKSSYLMGIAFGIMVTLVGSVDVVCEMMMADMLGFCLSKPVQRSQYVRSLFTAGCVIQLLFFLLGSGIICGVYVMRFGNSDGIYEIVGFAAWGFFAAVLTLAIQVLLSVVLNNRALLMAVSTITYGAVFSQVAPFNDRVAVLLPTSILLSAAGIIVALWCGARLLDKKDIS